MPPPKLKQSDKPEGRDLAKRSMQADILVSKVSKGVGSQLRQTDGLTGLAGSVHLDAFMEGLDKANDTMSTIADKHVMAMAPEAIKQKYFSDLYDSKISAMANK